MYAAVQLSAFQVVLLPPVQGIVAVTVDVVQFEAVMVVLLQADCPFAEKLFVFEVLGSEHCAKLDHVVVDRSLC